MPKSAKRVKPAWAVEAGLSDAEYRLAAKHGLYLRGRQWWTRIKGKRYPTSTRVLADAVEFVAKKRSDLWTAKKMGVKPPRSWREACQRREDESSESMKSWSDEAQRLAWWWPHLKHIKDLNEITREMVAEIIESGKLRCPDPSRIRNGSGFVRVDKSGPASCNTTANKYVRVVQTILNKAEREWSWGNRAAILKTYDEGLPRDAAPTPYEVVKLVEIMPAHTADMMVYGAMTMHRRANVTDLAWRMIDWDKRAVQIAGRLTKTGKPIYVPLNSVAMAILKRRYEAVDKEGKSSRHPIYVFTWRGKKITHVVTKAFRQSRAKVGMGDVCFHTMRHCGQTWLAEEGVTPEMRARLGGWTVRGMGAMDDYTHLNIEPLRPVADILATKWNAALALRRAELAAGKAVETEAANRTTVRAEVAENTISAQPTGGKRHSPWATA
jgi:integrase